MSTQDHRLHIADWSQTPGARTRDDGPDSGQAYLEDVLIPAFECAVAADARLRVDLDGGHGYSTGFLEEVFGGLARKFGSKAVRDRISIKSADEPFLEEDIFTYIDDVARRGGPP